MKRKVQAACIGILVLSLICGANPDIAASR